MSSRAATAATESAAAASLRARRYLLIGAGNGPGDSPYGDAAGYDRWTGIDGHAAVGHRQRPWLGNMAHQQELL